MAASFLLVCLATPSFGDIPEAAGDLLDEFELIKDAMPADGSEGYIQPELLELARWRDLTMALISLDVEAAADFLDEHFPFYTLYHFTDTGWEDRDYYLLREAFPVTKGWGTVVINPNFKRRLIVEVPHAITDDLTWREGPDIFRRTEARMLIMNGAHRCSSDSHSLCDGWTYQCGDGDHSEAYRITDMAHNVDTCFQVAHKAAADVMTKTTFLNLHGTTHENCEDFFFSNGVWSDSYPYLYDMRDYIRDHSILSAAVVGDGESACPYYGSTNVQGRYLNGSPAPCTEAAWAASGAFVHLEQSLRVRENPAFYGLLIKALRKAIDPTSAVAVSSFTAERTADGVELRWLVDWAEQHVGFRVLRREVGTSFSDVSGLLSGSGELYEFLDQGAPREALVYRLEELDESGDASLVRDLHVAASAGLPRVAVLGAWPNPANPQMTVSLQLASAGQLRVEVMDLSGRRMRVLTSGPQDAGRLNLSWDGKDSRGRELASGVYLLRLTAANYCESVKITMLR